MEAWLEQTYIQILICTISQLGSAASGEVYSMYCLTMAMAAILPLVSGLNDTPNTGTSGVDLHSTVGKDDRNANLLHSGHMQCPKQRHRHKQ